MNATSKPKPIYPECTICFEPLDKELVTSISCGHIFHNQCLHEWARYNNMKCPICRQDASATVKLIYDIKYTIAPSSGEEDQHELTTEQIVKENMKLKSSNTLLKNQIEEMKENYAKLNTTIDEYINKFKENEKRTKEYKQQLLMMNVQLNEEKAKNEMLKQDVGELKGKVGDLEKVKKELELQLGVNKEMNEFMSEIHQKEKEVNMKEHYIDIMSKNDGGRTLSEYFYVLEERIKRLTKENEELKKKHAGESGFGGEFILKEFVNKRKYGEFVGNKDSEKRGSGANENKERGKERQIINNYNNGNGSGNKGNGNTFFKNPLTMKKGLSFIQKK